MALLQLQGTYGYSRKLLLRWNRCGFRFKTNTKNISQLDNDTGGAESEIHSLFVNPSRGANQEAVSSLLESPLSLQYMNRNQNGERIYLGKYPSVTSILGQTKPPNEHFALLNWRKAQISELGKRKFNKQAQITFRKGQLFHQAVQLYFNSSNVPVLDEGSSDAGYWQSVKHVLKDVSNVVAVESAVAHPLLQYAGTLDLIAEYKGTLSVIDWKTSAKHKTNLKDCYSYPQQIVAYAGAVNFDENYPFQVCNGVIVIAYENGDPADVHCLSQEMCESYWLEWLARLQQYRKKFPECVISETDSEARETRNDVHEGCKFEASTDSPRSRSVNSIGVPLKSLGRIVKDEDVIDDEKVVDEEEFLSKRRFYGFSALLAMIKSPEALKRLCQSILQRVSSKGKK